MRPSGRQPDEMRQVTIETGVNRHAEGSALIAFGESVLEICWKLEIKHVPISLIFLVILLAYCMKQWSKSTNVSF